MLVRASSGSSGGGGISQVYLGAASANKNHTITYTDGVDEVYIFASGSGYVSIYTAISSLGSVEKGNSTSVTADSATASLSSDGKTLTFSRSSTDYYFVFIGIKR